MITMQKYFGHVTMADAPMTHKHNAETLIPKVNLINKAYIHAGGSEFIQTSGYRSIQDHLRIYSEINAKRIAKGLKALNVPMGSAHLSGLGIDVSDPEAKLRAWLKGDGAQYLIALDLYCEEGTDGWIHFQARRPVSGSRWFNP